MRTRRQFESSGANYGGHSTTGQIGGQGVTNVARVGAVASAYMLDDVRTLVSVVFGAEIPSAVEDAVSMIEDLVPDELLAALVVSTQPSRTSGGILPAKVNPLLQLLPQTWTIPAGVSLLAAIPGGSGVISEIFTKMGGTISSSSAATLAMFDAGTYGLAVSLGSGANGASFSLSFSVSLHASALPDRTDPAVCNELCELAHDVLGTTGTFRLEGGVSIGGVIAFNILAAVDGVQIELGDVTLTHIGLDIGASSAPAFRAFITAKFEVEQPTYDGPAYSLSDDGSDITFDHNLVCAAAGVANLESALSFTGGLGFELTREGPTARVKFAMDGFCKDLGAAHPEPASHAALRLLGLPTLSSILRRIPHPQNTHAHIALDSTRSRFPAAMLAPS